MTNSQTAKFHVTNIDTWEGDGGVGITISEEGDFTTFASAKAHLISSIDGQIRSLRHLKKEVQSMKRKDIKPCQGREQ